MNSFDIQALRNRAGLARLTFYIIQLLVYNTHSPNRIVHPNTNHSLLHLLLVLVLVLIHLAINIHLILLIFVLILTVNPIPILPL